MFKDKKGHSLLEVVLSTIIFSLIMLTITALLNIGLKSWQIGETSIDVQNAAEVTLHRLTGELKLTSLGSCVIEPDYIVFDSAIDDYGKFKIDSITRTPLWQNYILYYKYKADPNDDYSILYRKKLSHDVSSVANRATVDSNDLKPDTNSRIVAKSVERFEVTRQGDLLNIRLICSRKIGERKLPYNHDFDADKIKASIDILTSVFPRNN